MGAANCFEAALGDDVAEYDGLAADASNLRRSDGSEGLL